MTRPCECGKPAIERLIVHYRYLRTEPLPEAMDPYYVHGGGGHLNTCGSPACEASALLAVRGEIIGRICDGDIFSHPRELADSELVTTVSRPAAIKITGQPDGTARMSWPSAPREAI